ncbi:MAG: class C sortase [Oscillospiraceae bacterium]|nr:class C sortase [Oscillospiraceae bacterium]
MKKKSGVISTIIFTLIFIIGLAIMLYPIVSDWWNSKVQSRAVASYDQTVAEMDETEYELILQKARDYNAKVAKLNAPLAEADSLPEYYEILDVSGTGIMGYITIPLIKVEIPIYHGTSESVLNIAAGHLQGTAFPIGGENTHAVISAHRGLPTSKLFSDLDKLVVGDTFTVTILNEVYTYEVEDIFIVEPHEVEKLAVIPNGDYVTLMTCTPYGVNSHRLLLRSKRIETVYQSTVRVVSDAVQVDPLLVVPLLSTPLLIGLIIFWIFSGRKKKSLPYRNPLYTLPPRKYDE